MKIGIVTVYNSLNCGSFLQSYALQTILEQMGYEVFFVDAKTRKPLKVTVAKAINALKRFDFSLCGYLFQEYFSYYKALKLLNKCLAESDAPATYYDVHSICKTLKLSAPKFELILNELEKDGFEAIKTHYNPIGIKTDAEIENIKNILIKLNDI